MSENQVDVFELSSTLREQIASSAEILCDISKDERISKDAIADVFRTLKAANPTEEHPEGVVTYSMWEAVRKSFEAVYAVRARDNGAIDPAGAANDRWGEVTVYLREIHGLKKPSKSGESPESAAARMEAKRAKDREEAEKMAEGKSLADLQEAQVALYQTATPESIAKAKALDKAIKLVAKVEKEERKGAVGALKKGAQDAFKECLEALVEGNNERGLSDLILLLKRFPADCAQRDAMQ
jgi:hypothetical protein